jgi:hypothetical protein
VYDTHIIFIYIQPHYTVSVSDCTTLKFEILAGNLKFEISNFGGKFEISNFGGKFEISNFGGKFWRDGFCF